MFRFNLGTFSGWFFNRWNVQYKSAWRLPYNWAETCSWNYNLIQSNKL